MRFPLLLVLASLLATGVPLAVVPLAAAATCAPMNAACAGEAVQACGGPAPYGDGWDGFTGAWGEAAGVEYGAGGWDRCYPGYWSVGTFVNMDRFPAGGYQNAQVRFDYSPTGGRPCYTSAGVYGWETYSYFVACPDNYAIVENMPDPGWGHVLP